MSTVAFGVFGGSFDPPHLAHTLFAAYALAAHGLERVLVVPTFTHAFGKQLTPFDDRLRMCELAFGDLRRVEICDVERGLPAPNFTLHTLQALAARHANVQLHLLIGSDILGETQHWHDFASVARLAPPLVVERQGATSHDPEQPALPNISSTEIRKRIRAGERTSGWLAPSVADYIRAHGLYSAA